MISKPTKVLLYLSLMKGVGSTTLRNVMEIPDFENLSPEQIANRIPTIARILESDPDAVEKASELACKQLEFAKIFQSRILSAADPEYPTLLAATKDDPIVLYVAGKLHTRPERSLAIIGTRVPTKHGSTIAMVLAEKCGKEGISVVSGLAKGIDTDAHRGALWTGHTVAVLAHGFGAEFYPKENRDLAYEILEKGGALVTEYPCYTEPDKFRFVKRDKIQAGMAQGVVMVQSGLEGGSLHASRATLAQGRHLVVPYPTEYDRKPLEYGPAAGQSQDCIQANLVLADGAAEEKQRLLRCPPEALERVVIVRGREDYPEMFKRLSL